MKRANVFLSLGARPGHILVMRFFLPVSYPGVSWETCSDNTLVGCNWTEPTREVGGVEGLRGVSFTSAPLIIIAASSPCPSLSLLFFFSFWSISISISDLSPSNFEWAGFGSLGDERQHKRVEERKERERGGQTEEEVEKYLGRRRRRIIYVDQLSKATAGGEVLANLLVGFLGFVSFDLVRFLRVLVCM